MLMTKRITYFLKLYMAPERNQSLKKMILKTLSMVLSTNLNPSSYKNSINQCLEFFPPNNL